MIKKKTFSCIIFENVLTILSFDDKIIGRTRENSSFYRNVPLNIVVLLDGICASTGGVGGGVGVGVGIGGFCGIGGGGGGSIDGGGGGWLVLVVLEVVLVIIEDDLLELAEDPAKFNNYPWGYDIYKLTVKYLLKNISPRTITLYGFPWPFMVKDYPDEVSHLRILRWLAGKSNTKIEKVDYFNPPNDAVEHPWIIHTQQKLGMTSFITLDFVDTIAHPTVELIKKKLAGEIAIKRVVRKGTNIKTLYDQPAATDLGVASGGVSGGVVHIGGNHVDVDVDANTGRDDEHFDAQEKINIFEITPYTSPSHPYGGPSHPSSPSYFYYKYKECKDRPDKLFEKIDTITEVI
ncbi:hypothetical protein FXO37_15262 [Capsicum annuum]|nr:hypothetical protein FXO37_15262 [Capsicum annuum]